MYNFVFFISNNILEWCLKSKLKIIMVMMVVSKIGIVKKNMETIKLN